MKNLPKFFNIAFDCIAEPALFVNSKNEVVFANKAFLNHIANLCSQPVTLDDLASLIVDLKMVSSNTAQVREFALNGSKEKLKVDVTALASDYSMLRVIQGLSGENIKVNLHSQRIETLGMLAGGIAHDFNNILTGILGHVTYLKTLLPQEGGHVVSLSAVEEGARRASSLTQEILNFSRLENSEKPQRIELGDVIERTFHLLRGAISPEFELEFSVPEEPVCVLANEAKIAQVLVNLAMNARDAVDSGGVIRIHLDTVNDSKELNRVFAGKDLSSTDFARIKVVDNGQGMSAEVMHRVFEPYYSTKKDKGTGLGLAIVSEVVRMYAGAIEITSVEGQGTSVSVYLPLLAEMKRALQKPGAKKLEVELRGGTERILVVDDEYPVRNVLSLSLEHLGYEVAIAASGTEALELYRQSPAPYDLVILDMLMPNLSGDQTFFRLKEIDPNVNVLVISGYSSQEAVNSILDNGGLGFVQKPFTITELAKRVRQCFE